MGNPQSWSGFCLHWMVWNIPPSTSTVPEATEPEGVVGENDFGYSGYTGPRPDPGITPYTYRFRLYALDMKLKLPPNTGLEKLRQAMEEHILARATLRAHYCSQSGGLTPG